MSGTPGQRVDIAAVMLTWNSFPLVRVAVERVLEDARISRLSLQLTVVDNGSTDETPDLLRDLARERGMSVRPVFLARNRGTTVPRNIAIRSSRSPYILILDSDTLVERGALAALVGHLAGHAEVALAVPRLLDADGAVQPSARRFPTIITKVLRSLPSRIAGAGRAADEEYGQFGAEPTDVDYAISACWLLRRSALARVGLLDERIFYAPEDADYCLRLWQAGYRVQIVPQALAIHDARRLTHRSPTSLLAIRHFLGLCHFWRKHGFLVGRARLYRRLGIPRSPG